MSLPLDSHFSFHPQAYWMRRQDWQRSSNGMLYAEVSPKDAHQLQHGGMMGELRMWMHKGEVSGKEVHFLSANSDYGRWIRQNTPAFGHTAPALSGVLEAKDSEGLFVKKARGPFADARVADAMSAGWYPDQVTLLDGNGHALGNIQVLRPIKPELAQGLPGLAAHRIAGDKGSEIAYFIPERIYTVDSRAGQAPMRYSMPLTAEMPDKTFIPQWGQSPEHNPYAYWLQECIAKQETSFVSKADAVALQEADQQRQHDRRQPSAPVQAKAEHTPVQPPSKESARTAVLTQEKTGGIFGKFMRAVSNVLRDMGLCNCCQQEQQTRSAAQGR